MKARTLLLTFFLVLFGTLPSLADTPFELTLAVDDDGDSQVEITYVYKYGNTEWYRETKSATIGEGYPAVSSRPDGVRFLSTPPVGQKVTGSETVEIACGLDPNFWITASPSYEEANWTYLSIHDLSKLYLYYDTENPDELTLDATAPKNTDAFKWAVIFNPFTGQHKIVNKAAGPTMVLSSKNPKLDTRNTGGTTYIHLVADDGDLEAQGYNTYWNLTRSVTGFFLSRAGETIYAKERDGKLAYSTTGTDWASRMYFVPVTRLTAVTGTNLKSSTGSAVTSDHQYRLVNRAWGKALELNSPMAYGVGDYEVITAIADENRQKWTLTATGSGFTIQNVNFGTYVSGNTFTDTNNEFWKYYNGIPFNVNGVGSGYTYPGIPSSEAVTMYFFKADEVDGTPYYYISTSATQSPVTNSGRCILSTPGGPVMPYASRMGLESQWSIECVDDDNSYATTINTGYYRLVNDNYGTVCTMYDTGNYLSTAEYDAANYSQLWYITKSGSSYTLQNAVSGHYAGRNPGIGNQWPVATSATTFSVSSKANNGRTVFAFSTSGNALHCNSAHNVVPWNTSAAASYWRLEPVTLTAAQQAELSELTSTAPTVSNSTLLTFFDDYACTQLKSTYANYTDAALRSAMSSLPTAVQDMAVRVKNNSWNTDATWNAYERDFRIHDYQVYSEPQTWTDFYKIGPFARLTQPTGIRYKAGQIAYIYVNDAVANTTDGHLYAEFVMGTDQTGSQTTLQRGYNAIKVASDCELFITYNCTNRSRLLSTLPDIRIHVEGGTCNGFFDLSRGHTNTDWYWMVDNMFKDKYLHVKGISTLLNVFKDDVAAAKDASEVMELWDFIFDTEQEYILGVNGAYKGDYEGRYRMMLNSRKMYDGEGQYTHWAGHYGTNHLALSTDNSFSSYVLTHPDDGGGTLWELAHEIGHGHQYPFQLGGAGEISNNSLCQIVNHLVGYRSSRGSQPNAMQANFNQGLSWVDYMRGSNYSDNTETINNLGTLTIPSDVNYSQFQSMCIQLWYQLYLYFHVQGNDPDFFPKWVRKIKEMGYIQMGTSSSISQPATSRRATDLAGTTSTAGDWRSEYMRLALAACAAAETDLYEYFKAWGFFRYANDIKITGTKDNNPVFNVSSYNSTRYVRMPVKGNAADEADLLWCRNKMQSYAKKAPGILFIGDATETITIRPDALVLQYDPSQAGKQQLFCSGVQGNAGSLGMYTNFGANKARTLAYTVNNTSGAVRVTGSGAVGIKVYDDSGEMVYATNATSFNPATVISDGLKADGKYTLVASLGDGTDLILARPGATRVTMTTYYGSRTNVQSYNTSGTAKPTGNSSLALYATGDCILPDLSVTPNAMTTISATNENTPAMLQNQPNFIYAGTAQQLRLTDEVDYYAPSAYTAESITYSRANTRGFNSMCLPFAVDVEEFGSGAKVYVLEGMDASSVTFTQQKEGTIDPATPILVYLEDDAWDFSLSDASRAVRGTVQVVSSRTSAAIGAFLTETIGEGYYVVGADGSTMTGTDANTTILPFRFYVRNTSATDTSIRLIIKDDDGGSTAIGHIDAGGALQFDTIYDLQGRRVAQPQRGHIYIVGGKKVRF